MVKILTIFWGVFWDFLGLFLDFSGVSGKPGPDPPPGGGPDDPDGVRMKSPGGSDKTFGSSPKTFHSLVKSFHVHQNFCVDSKTFSMFVEKVSELRRKVFCLENFFHFCSENIFLFGKIFSVTPKKLFSE